jgi:flagellar biogenesis protein FliO
MNRITLLVGWTWMAISINGALANDWAVEIPSPQSTSADQSPRYLPQDQTTVRPIESSEPRQREMPAAAVSESPSASGLIPRLRSAERLASGSNEQAAAPPPPIAQPAATARPSLLLPPAEGEGRGSRQRNDIPALATGAASLAIVVGLFLVVVWAVRRGMPKGAGLLPPEALEVLGRAALVGKQQLHLVRCGNKLLLVCVCGLTVQTLTEITDPAEVERISELCQSHSAATAANFAQVLRQFSSSSRHAGYDADGHDQPDFGALDSDLHHVRGSLA